MSDDAAEITEHRLAAGDGSQTVFLVPKERRRDDVHKHPAYYAVRNHLIDFLVARSRTFADEIRAGRDYDPKKPPEVVPSAPGPIAVPPPLRPAPSIESVEKRSGRVP